MVRQNKLDGHTNCRIWYKIPVPGHLPSGQLVRAKSNSCNEREQGLNENVGRKIHFSEHSFAFWILYYIHFGVCVYLYICAYMPWCGCYCGTVLHAAGSLVP